MNIHGKLFHKIRINRISSLDLGDRVESFDETMIIDIIDKKLKKTGIITPEELGTNQNYFDYVINYLENRKISINFADEKNSLEKE